MQQKIELLLNIKIEQVLRIKNWIKVQKSFKSKIFKKYRFYRPRIIIVCIISKYFKFLVLLSTKFEVISIQNSCSNNIFITLLMCFFFSSFWLKNLVYKVYVFLSRDQFISLSTQSEIYSYKLRSKCAKFHAFYRMFTIISPFMPTIHP